MWYPQVIRLVRLLITLLETAQAQEMVREETRGWAALVTNTCMKHQRIVFTTATYGP